MQECLAMDAVDGEGQEDGQKRLRKEASGGDGAEGSIGGGDLERGDMDENCRRSRRAKQPRIAEEGFVNIEAIEFDSICKLRVRLA